MKIEVELPAVGEEITWVQVTSGSLIQRRGRVLSHHEAGIKVAWIGDSGEDGPAVFLQGRIFWMNK